MAEPTLKELLLSAPESQLDAKLHPIIQTWPDQPTALQILEVLDHCIHGALASGVVVTLLQIFYKKTCEAEGVTHEELVPKATWRKTGAPS